MVVASKSMAAASRERLRDSALFVVLESVEVGEVVQGTAGES